MTTANHNTLHPAVWNIYDTSDSADEGLALSPDGKYVRRKHKYERLSAAELGFCKATKAVQVSLQFASGCKHAGVMVPADVRYGLTTSDLIVCTKVHR